MGIPYRSIAGILYIELMNTAMILLLILLINSLVLYKRKLTDHLSLMLVASCIVSGLEIARYYTEGNPEMQVQCYVFVCVYAIVDLFATMEFTSFFIGKFGFELRSRKHRIMGILYWAPLMLMSFVILTTPWTHLLFEVDANGDIHERILYHWLFSPMLTIYLLLTAVFAVYRLITFRRSGKEMVRTAISVLIFGLLFQSTTNLQNILLKSTGSDMYMSFSLAWAISMVFLVHTVNTTTLVQNETQTASIKKEMGIAASIQSGALPDPTPDFPEAPDVHLRAFIKPAQDVGGDFYDYFFADQDHLCFVIADVSGKGVSAALFMMTVKTMIKDHAVRFASTREIAKITNHLLCEANGEEMFATAWIGVMNTRTKLLRYTNAGHTKPFLRRKGGEWIMLRDTHGMPLGSVDNMVYERGEIQLTEGDSLFLYTDGITEAVNRKNIQFGSKRVAEVLKKTQDLPGEAVCEEMQKTVEAYEKGKPQFDDITMMMLKIG